MKKKHDLISVNNALFSTTFQTAECAICIPGSTSGLESVYRTRKDLSRQIRFKRFTATLLPAFLLALCTPLFAKTTFDHNERFGPGKKISRAPENPIYIDDHFNDIEVQNEAEKTRTVVESKREKLAGLAQAYSKRKYIPYVWGGENIGEKDECLSCRKCAERADVPFYMRKELCPSCQECGVDCSHFAFLVYRQLGLDVRYATSAELLRQTSKGLLKLYDFVDLGKDHRLAEPGDLLVFEQHVAVLVELQSRGRALILHASRFKAGDLLELGGIRLESRTRLSSFRRGVKRVLRHVKMMEPEHRDVPSKLAIAIKKHKPKG